MDEIFVAFEEEHLRTLFSCYTRLLVQCLKLFRFKASEYILSVSRVISVTRLGNFFIFLAINFITKVAQMFGDFLGSCEKHCFLKSNLIGYFWGNFWKNLGFFISTSGHTDYVPYLLRLPKVLHGIGSLGLEQFPFATGAARDSTPATSCSRLQPVDSTIHAPDRTSTSW